jgi:hypothetical protein
MRISPLLFAVSLTWGCSARADQVFSAPGLLTGSSGAQPGYAIKLVWAKEAPSALIGDDGSVCRVIAERFTQVDEGDWVGCEWTIEVESDTTAGIAQAGA